VAEFISLCRKAFPDDQPHQARATRLLLSQLVCLGRHSVTGLITTAGRELRDWSADYKFFNKGRFDYKKAFGVALKEVLKMSDHEAPLIVAIDDTIVRKTGRKTHGVKWRRDPLGPPFQVNLIKAQRFLQLSAAITSCKGTSRMIPIDLFHAPSNPKAGDPTITQTASKRIDVLRAAIDQVDGDKPLWIVGDGGYTNAQVLKNLPANTVFIGRARKDAKLYFQPTEESSRGRHRVYGAPAPRPEELASDQQTPWTELYLKAHGRKIRFRYKSLGELKSRTAGGAHTLRMITVAPRRYQLRKGGKFLYKGGVHLICTDTHASIKEILQAYLLRWDLEVNFREQKTILGMGEAAVRTEVSTQSQPACVAVAYSFAHIAEARAIAGPEIPRPKWRRKTTSKTRLSTNQLLQKMRQELWFSSINHFSGFVSHSPGDTKPEKIEIPLKSAVIYAISA
jgi:hypothetical protein